MATKKGAAVLDQWLPAHIKEQYHVLQEAGVNKAFILSKYLYLRERAKGALQL